MPIKKDELMNGKVLTKVEITQIRRVEECIDNQLRAFYEGSPIGISIRSLSSRVQRELLRRYVAAGWKVKFEYDQREGNFIKLS